MMPRWIVWLAAGVLALGLLFVVAELFLIWAGSETAR